MHDPIQDVARLLADAAPRGVVALTGAGISAASGIPTFRDTGGFWTRYDPLLDGHIDAFHRDPHRVWRMLLELDAVVRGAVPNPAHRALAELEQLSVVERVLTQNADGLHQAAVSGEVVELHGTARRLRCLHCTGVYERSQLAEALESGRTPECPGCGAVLRPDAVLFGESLPADAVSAAVAAVERCEVLLVIGTSAEVYPVASFPQIARATGARVVEVNPSPVLGAHHALIGPAEDLLGAVVEQVRPLVSVVGDGRRGQRRGLGRWRRSSR